MVKIKNPTEGGRRGLGREEKQPRINGVAYEVVRITQALESPGSLIVPISSYATIVTGTERKSESLAIVPAVQSVKTIGAPQAPR